MMSFLPAISVARSARNGSLSGLPGPKCLRMTSGSLPLAILDADAGGRRVGGDEQLVLRHLAEADHRRRADAMAADGAFALHDDQPVGGGVRDGDASVSAGP